MTRSFAAAVLYAVVSFTSSANLDDAVVDFDDDDDGVVECVEYRREHGNPDRTGVLARASQICGEQINDAWVLYGKSGCVGAAALRQPSGHVVFLDMAGEHAEVLLSRALASCRDMGALKVVVEARDMEPTSIQALAESVGFQFSRARQVDGGQRLEFYTNLYWRGGAAPRQA